MKSIVFQAMAVCLVACCGMLSISSCTDSASSGEEPVAMSDEEKIAHGKYLVQVMDCEICHTPKVMTDMGPVFDTTRTLSGHPAGMMMVPPDLSLIAPGKWSMAGPHFTEWYGPWGVSFAANLTPDVTGIEAFTLDHFKTVLRKGKFKGLETGRDIKPPMPWQAYSALPDDEIEAIFMYLKSLKPISNLVPPTMSYDELVASAAAPEDAE